MTRTELETALTLFRTRVEAKFFRGSSEVITDGYGQSQHLEWSHGSKYVRLIKTDGSNRSSYGFVDAATGDLLKSASWKAPAKGVRGHISDPCLGGCGPYSIK